MTARKMGELLSKGYNLRKKIISGKAYAYAQKSRKFKYIGPWSKQYERFLNKPRKKQVESSKSQYDSMMKAYGAYLTGIEYSVKLDGRRICEYINEVIRRVNPDLCERFTNLASKSGVESAFSEGVQICGSYIDRAKDAKAKGIKMQSTQDYVTEVMEKWIQHAIAEKLGRHLKPGVASSRCPNCRTPIEHSNKDNTYSLLCPKCDHGSSFSCQICGSTMGFAPDAGNGVFTCPLCGYRLIPDEKILPTITKDYAIAAYYLRTDDPRLKGLKLVITKTDSEGHERTDVIKSW